MEFDEPIVEPPAGVLAAVLVFVFAFFGCVFTCAVCVDDIEFEPDMEFEPDIDDELEFEPDIVFELPAGVDCANAAPPSTKLSAIAGTIIFIGCIKSSLDSASLRRRPGDLPFAPPLPS